MNWPPQEDKLVNDASRILGDLLPEEVLYEFEGPCIFTSRSASGNLLLAYLAEDIESEKSLHYLVATVTEESIDNLKHGRSSVKEVLTSGWLWLAELSYEHKIKKVFHIQEQELPEDMLPADETMLWAHLEPILRVRLQGEKLVPGQLPASVLSQASEIAERALKSVFEFALGVGLPSSVGRPPNEIRELYNLPTQRFAYGSFEISFRSPKAWEPQPEEDEQLSLSLDDANGQEPSIPELLEKGWDLLRAGIMWASGQDEETFASLSSDEQLAVLESLYRLTPNPSGDISEIMLSGSKVSRIGTVYNLDQNISKRVRSLRT